MDAVEFFTAGRAKQEESVPKSHKEIQSILLQIPLESCTTVMEACCSCRCVNKYLEVHSKVGVELQNQGPGQPGEGELAQMHLVTQMGRECVWG